MLISASREKFVVVQIDEVARRSAVAGGLFLRYPLVPTRNKDVVHIALLRFGNGIIPLFLKIRACRNAPGVVRAEPVVVGRDPAPAVIHVVTVRIQHRVAERAVDMLCDGYGHDAVVAVLFARSVPDALQLIQGKPSSL